MSMKAWITPSFADFGCEPQQKQMTATRSKVSLSSSSSCVPSRTTRSSAAATPPVASTAASATSRKQAKLTAVPKQEAPFQLLRRDAHTADNRYSSSSSRSSNTALADKYAPNTRQELVVNKAKVDQLSNLLDELSSRARGEIVLMEGPSGCGKYCSLRILCKEKGVELIVWDSSQVRLSNLNVGLEMDAYSNNSGGDYSSGADAYGTSSKFAGGGYGDSQATLFRQYLFKSSRYLTDQIFGADDSTAAAGRTSKLLLVKEIPNFAYRDLPAFHAILRDFVRFARFSLVFALTNASASANDSSHIKLFPSELRRELRMREIAFNALAATFMQRQLERICGAERLAFASASYLAGVVAASTGDLRHALNQLEMARVQTAHESDGVGPIEQPTITSASQRASSKSQRATAAAGGKVGRARAGAKGKTASADASSSGGGGGTAADSSKDLNYGIFRGLGKILYRKNLDAAERQQEHQRDKFAAEQRLPAHLVARGLQRQPMSVAPDELHTKIPLTADSIVMYLHQNYLELFALRAPAAPLDAQLDALASIADGFMCADQIGARLGMMFDLTTSIQEHKLKEIATLIAMRSILFNFDFESAAAAVSGSGGGGASSGSNGSAFTPLFKPYIHKMLEMKSKRTKLAQQILFEDADLSRTFTGVSKEFFVTILPYILQRSRLLTMSSRKQQAAAGSSSATAVAAAAAAASWQRASGFARGDNLSLFGTYKTTSSKQIDQSGELIELREARCHETTGGDADAEAALRIVRTQQPAVNATRSNYTYDEADLLDIDERLF